MLDQVCGPCGDDVVRRQPHSEIAFLKIPETRTGLADHAFRYDGNVLGGGLLGLGKYLRS